jgi:outer membrane protein assembly factor BamA
VIRLGGAGRGSRRSLGRRGTWLALALAALVGSESARAQPAPGPAAPEPRPSDPAKLPEALPAPGGAATPGPAGPGQAPAGTPAPKPTPEPATPSPAGAPPAGAAPPAPGATAPVGAAAEADEENDLKYTLDGIEVRGNTKTRSRVVLRYVPFKAGDVIDVESSEFQLTRYRLLGTGFFRDVELALRKGARRGHVVLVVEVVERNTLIVNDLWMGLAADAETNGNERPLTAYGGIDVAETNLVGTGVTLGAAVAGALDQSALRIRFFDPAFLGTSWMTNGTLLFNNADDFFGNRGVLVADPYRPSPLPPEIAIVQYKRFGGSVGIGRDLSVSTQLWAHYRLEGIDAQVPRVASHLRGTPEATGAECSLTQPTVGCEPIDFSIIKGDSLLSTISATLQHDTRDKPFLTTKGWFASVTPEVSLTPLGSDYAYSRIDVLAEHWWQLPWSHVLRLRLYGGAIAGKAPFFEQYYVGDLSDFRAGRVLGMNVERRPAPNFFNTDIVEILRGDYAAKFDFEYRIPLYKGSRAVYGIDLFARAGLFGIAGLRDITDPPAGYRGARLIPIDFTANIGVQMDTSAGGFTFALANVIGFLPALSEGR